jgi:hypothetical protein
MSMQRLHLSASLGEKCKGPVVSGWLGVREGEITKEIEVRRFGGVLASSTLEVQALIV